MKPRPAPLSFRAHLARWPHWPLALVGAYATMLALALATATPLPQDAAYHDFADTRTLAGVPRAGDVLSNAALLAAGLAGLWVLHRRRPVPAASAAPAGTARTLFVVFFAAVALTALGSAFYHWAPDNARLVWDRLPLSVIAASFPALPLAERSPVTRLGRRVLWLWLGWAPLTVLYWIGTEAAGMGDLRPYLLVQATAMLGALAALALLPPRHTLGWAYAITAALYALAMASEQADQAVFAATGWISGHTLKHLLAAAAVGAMAAMLALRGARPPPAD